MVIRVLLLLCLASGSGLRAETIGLWLFDEPSEVYPSSILADATGGSHFLILGRGGEIAGGRFGNALRVVAPREFQPSFDPSAITFKEVTQDSLVASGLESPPRPPGRRTEPLTWSNATFAATFLNGETHLRGSNFPNASDSRLNLGSHDWTVEFWLRLEGAPTESGVVFELGTGPREDNRSVTRLSLAAGGGAFELFNEPAGKPVSLPTNAPALRRGEWVHCAFVYASATGELRHYANGRLHGPPAKIRIQRVPHGDASYFSVGRDGSWANPLPGLLDELRFSDHLVYAAEFTNPASFARMHDGSRPPLPPRAGPPLLFAGEQSTTIELGSRRHVFIDDALLATRRGIEFHSHPARIAEPVLEENGWLSVVEDDEGRIRLYVTGPKDAVAVYLSRDGVHFEAPDLGSDFHGARNIVITDPATVGCVFRDPNGRPGERWKLVSGLRGRGGIFVYTSDDGLRWRRHESTSLPFWAGSAVNVFYDDQRQRYVVHNRSDYFRTPGGAADRKSVLLEVEDLLQPWPFRPVTRADTEAAIAAGARTRAAEVDPWWLTHGPLAPGRIGIEYPIAFAADPAVDPIGTDVYNTRAQKYSWAEDTYVAFPLFFFHYHHDGPAQRGTLAEADEQRGTGMLETQLAVSRDGLNWKRYPRPVYLGVGEVEGYPMKRSYIGYGMVRRGRELWQYSHSRASYHDAHQKGTPAPDVIHRLVQRVDGFVSIDADYQGGEFTTKPLRFTGNRLQLNIDTEATGFAQVGLLDESGRPIPGFGTDACIYINGDEVDYEVRWLNAAGEKISDVSALAGTPVRLHIRMRGSSLYALQFVTR